MIFAAKACGRYVRVLQTALFVSSLLVFSVHAGTSIFGLTLNEPLRLSECPYKQSLPASPATLGVNLLDADTPISDTAPREISEQLKKLQSSIRDKGVFIALVRPLSVADKSGIRTGDVLTTIGTKQVLSSTDVKREIDRLKPPITVSISILRNGDAIKFDAEFDGSPKHYDVTPDATCVHDFQKINTYNQRVRRVVFGKNEAPVWLKNWQLIALEANGNLIGIEFFTWGLSSQELVFSTLVNKFGQPTSKTTSQTQNSMGAEYQVINARWATSDIEVRFEGATDRVDSGRVVIDLPEATRIRAKWMEPHPKERAF